MAEKSIRGAIDSKLSIEFTDTKTAKAVHIALSPDNHDFPKGMNFDQKLKGNSIEIKISVSKSENQANFDQPLNSLVATLDEIVAHIYSVTQTLEKVESIHDRHSNSERKS